MKEPITEIIALFSGLIVALFFILLWYFRYGKLYSSISRTAYYLQKDKKVLEFFGFIAGLSISVMIGGQTMLSTIGGGMLIMIGILTGYNPNIINDKWEDILHIIFVDLSFTLILSDFIRLGAFSLFDGINYPFIFYCVLIGLFLLYMGIIFLFSRNNHTTKIEYGMILTVLIGYLFKNIWL